MPTSSKDLWASALEDLAQGDRQQLDFYKGQDRVDILSDLQVLTESAKGQCIKKRWQFRRPGRNGETIVLRDIFHKIVVWINIFKQIGDTVVQYDPGHAALPWAGVRFILQVAINDIVKFDFVVKGVESIARMIGRYAIFEDVYLRRVSKASTELEDALIQLYSTILLYQSKAKSFFDQSSPKRMLSSAFVTEDDFESLIRKMDFEQSNVDRCAAILDAENLNDISDSLEALSIGQNEKHTGLMNLLRTIDGPILRMSSQLNGIEDHLDRSKRFEILRWVSAQPYLEHHEQISKRVLAGTGRWLLEDPIYASWHNGSTSSLLWLHGKVGAGKSTLVSIVIEDAKRRFSARQSPPPVFFYCSRNAAEPQRSDPAAILSSIVRQLSCTEPGLPLLPPVIEIYERKGQGFNSQGLQVEECRDLITKLIENYPVTTIVIDALDECNLEKREMLLDAIESLLQDSSLGLLKVFLSSRDDQDISCTLREYPNLDLVSSRNSADIEAFVRAETNRLVNKQRLLRNSHAKESLKVLIIDEVAKGADGMFKWASLQLELLCTMKLDQDVRARLGRIPPELEQLYQEIYDKNLLKYPGEVGRSIISNIMKWLLCAQRQMKSSEFCTAVVLNTIPAEELTNEHVLDLCHNFVVFDDSLDVFRFAHASVREFLEKQNEYTAISCHLLAAETCLLQFIGLSDWSVAKAFLQHNYTLELRDKAASTEKLLGGFHTYATMYWARHCQLIGEGERRDNKHFERIFRFFLFDASDALSPLNIWIRADRRISRHSNLQMFLIGNRSCRPEERAFLIACAYAFCEVISVSMHENPSHGIDKGCSLAISHREGEALKILLSNSSEDEIPILLVRDVARKMDSGTLDWVFRKSKADLTTLLDKLMEREALDKGLVERLIARYGTLEASTALLEYAAKFCSANTFESVMRRNEDSGTSWDLLIEQAGQEENWEVVKLLWDKKNLRVAPSVMHAVALSGDEKALRLLLDREDAGEITCDVINASVLNNDEQVLGVLLGRAGSGVISKKAVTRAIRNSNERVLGLLLEKGYPMSQNLVDLAASQGFTSTLRLLLDRGGLITASVLGYAVENFVDGENMTRFLLAEAKHCMIMEEIAGMMRIAAQYELLGMMRLLLEKPGNTLIPEDVLVTATTSRGQGELIKILSGRDWEMTEEVVKVMMRTLASGEELQLVLDRLEGLEITRDILLAAASNSLFGDQLVGLLLDRVNLIEVLDPLLVEAAGNNEFGLEVILLLQQRVDHITFTQKALERAAQEKSTRTTTFLLDHISAPITEAVVLGALRSKELRMVQLVLDRAADLPITQNMIYVAARYCGFDCLAFIWKRARRLELNGDFARDLAQAAIENRYGAKERLRFLLDEIGNTIIGPEALISIAGKASDPIALLTLLIEHGVNLQFTREVLQAAAGRMSNDSSLVIFLLERSNEIELDDEIFRAAAASGSVEVLQVLCEYSGSAEIPQKWNDLVRLHDAVGSYMGFVDYCSSPFRRITDPDHDVVMELIARGVEPDVPDGHGRTPLSYAAELGMTSTFQALLSAGADPHSTDGEGRTPLFQAAAEGHYPIVQILLGLGVRTHIEDENGWTPASKAAFHGHMRMFRLLERRKQP